MNILPTIFFASLISFSSLTSPLRAANCPKSISRKNNFLFSPQYPGWQSYQEFRSNIDVNKAKLNGMLYSLQTKRLACVYTINNDQGHWFALISQPLSGFIIPDIHLIDKLQQNVWQFNERHLDLSCTTLNDTEKNNCHYTIEEVIDIN